MRAKILTMGAVALLVAAAFFLPELLLAWEDGQSLNVLQMESQDAEREGFAESIQLSVAEKIYLLRSGTLTAMDLDRMQVESMHITDAQVSSSTVFFFSESGEAQDVPPDLKAGTEEEINRYLQETNQLWEDRVASAGAEIRSLQTLGGLPELWKTDSPPDYTGYGDYLYLDPGTHISFQVYQITLDWGDYNLNLLVDVQSERILAFTLQWVQGRQPNWGPRGASGFGSAWRDYWKMDSVSTGWYNEYTRSVLENVESQVTVNGSHAAHDQITFMYDSQSLSIPLECQGSWGRSCALVWNR